MKVHYKHRQRNPSLKFLITTAPSLVLILQEQADKLKDTIATQTEIMLLTNDDRK
jgi:hypothetical protein